jgi:hypothetical protein
MDILSDDLQKEQAPFPVSMTAGAIVAICQRAGFHQPRPFIGPATSINKRPLPAYELRGLNGRYLGGS